MDDFEKWLTTTHGGLCAQVLAQEVGVRDALRQAWNAGYERRGGNVADFFHCSHCGCVYATAEDCGPFGARCS